MYENRISLKSISELLPYGFFIPSYQRGYRWTDQEVEDLLKDISEFIPKEVKGTEGKTWYCLQPVVVKKRGEKWEVIDGQQRLTTIFMIAHYLNQDYAATRRKSLFELEYDTRKGSGNFLKERLGELEMDESNIDYYFISKGYKTISSWFDSKGLSFDRNNFESKFYHSTRVIWYETSEGDPIDIFTRLNVGKIELTNAELIKALFLNSSNFRDEAPDKVRMKQLEIASEWDRMEYDLQNDPFWYFLNSGTNSMSTRIEFIFDLMVQKPEKADKYFTFRYFNEKFKINTKEEIIKNWQEVKRYYQTLEEWYSDRELYHMIGFLIITGTKIRDLVILLREEKSKTLFKASLCALIREKVKVQLPNLTYQDAATKSVLLLHNIQTMLKSDRIIRFPFDRFTKEDWDKEHIRATAEGIPKTEKYQRDWLNEASTFLPAGELKNKALIYDKDRFPEIYSEIIDYFLQNEAEEDTNDISNLALLNAGINRGYGNAVFPVKRNKIIEKDKSGAFIPICTKNVFLKYYSNEVGQMTYWDEQDRKNYIEDIAETLKDYLPMQISDR